MGNIEHSKSFFCGGGKNQIKADPPDINILPGYGNDPRTVDNLLDGVNRTCDDLHMWLAPFTPHKKHVVTITFDQTVPLAMIRVWNYNKSRIHSYRGVRHANMRLDGKVIFEGEIRRAPGHLESMDSFAEVILFTCDDAILKAVEDHDTAVMEE